MTTEKQIYKCEVCGNTVEVLKAGIGGLVCCNQAMALLQENSQEASEEKHLPLIEGNIVKVGSVPHPMEEDHFIEWIEATSKEGLTCRKRLNPHEEPKAEFSFPPASARALCNLHGLWKK